MVEKDALPTLAREFPRLPFHGRVAADRFARDASSLDKRVHSLALSRRPGRLHRGRADSEIGERIASSGDEFWIDYARSGVGNSKLSPNMIDSAYACGRRPQLDEDRRNDR
jgi:hypothetical protein